MGGTGSGDPNVDGWQGSGGDSRADPGAAGGGNSYGDPGSSSSEAGGGLGGDGYGGNDTGNNLGNANASGYNGGDSVGGQDPLILNLAGGKVRTTDAATSGVMFDYNDGVRRKTAWAAAGEAMLVYDPNGTAVTTGWSVVKTFGELQAFDRNGDGKLDASDPLWSKLKVWVQTGVDASGNPQGTLKTFADLGIQSINLASTSSGGYDNGNMIPQDGSFTYTDGRTGDRRGCGWASEAPAKKLPDALLTTGDVSNTLQVFQSQNATTIRFGAGQCASAACARAKTSVGERLARIRKRLRCRSERSRVGLNQSLKIRYSAVRQSDTNIIPLQIAA
jgi:hypothetical protein